MDGVPFEVVFGVTRTLNDRDNHLALDYWRRRHELARRGVREKVLVSRMEIAELWGVGEATVKRAIGKHPFAKCFALIMSCGDPMFREY